jgi:hypothetical protein
MFCHEPKITLSLLNPSIYLSHPHKKTNHFSPFALKSKLALLWVILMMCCWIYVVLMMWWGYSP